MPNEKVTFKIDNLKIDVSRATFLINAQRTDLGIPKMELPIVSAMVTISLNDSSNIKWEDIQKLFDLSTALNKKDRIKPVVLEFWSDLSKENPTACYKFNGWISSFRTSNFPGDFDRNGRDGGNFNHYIEMEVTPDYTDGNFKSVKFGN
jgi:hypothetical protein